MCLNKIYIFLKNIIKWDYYEIDKYFISNSYNYKMKNKKLELNNYDDDDIIDNNVCMLRKRKKLEV